MTSQRATPSSCVQKWPYSERVRLGNRLSQLLRTKTIRFSVTNTTYPVIFSSVTLEVIPYYSRFRVGLFRQPLPSTRSALRACSACSVLSSCSAVNKLITDGTTPALPCWGSMYKTRVTTDTRLRKLVNTRTCHVLHSYQSYCSVM